MISHYTSVDTLELILKNSTIRFNRLDRVDDLLEVKHEIAPDFGANWFVSCWTKDENESIPMWESYGKGHTGVRITLVDFPFIEHRISGNRGKNGWGVDIPTEIIAPFSFDEVFRDGFIVIPDATDDNLGGAVTYVDNPQRFYPNFVETDKDKMTVYKSGQLARLKDKSWDFQNEYRFLLTCRPGPPRNDLTVDYDSDLADFYSKKGVKGVPNVQYIDVRLSPLALSSMVITLGLNTSEQDAIRVKQLITQHSPTARIIESSFKGRVRPKA